MNMLPVEISAQQPYTFHVNSTFSGGTISYPNGWIQYNGAPQNYPMYNPSSAATFEASAIDGFGATQKVYLTLTLHTESELNSKGIYGIEGLISYLRDSSFKNITDSSASNYRTELSCDSEDVVGTNCVATGHGETRQEQPAASTLYSFVHEPNRISCPSMCVHRVYQYATLFEGLAYVFTYQTEHQDNDQVVFKEKFPEALSIARSLCIDMDRNPVTKECPPPTSDVNVNTNDQSQDASSPKPVGPLLVRDLNKNNYPITDEWINTTPTGGQSLNNVQISCSPESEFSDSKASSSECLNKPDNIQKVMVGVGSNCTQPNNNCQFTFADKILISNACTPTESCSWWQVHGNGWDLTVHKEQGNKEKMPVTFEQKSSNDVTSGGNYNLRFLPSNSNLECDPSTDICTKAGPGLGSQTSTPDTPDVPPIEEPMTTSPGLSEQPSALLSNQDTLLLSDSQNSQGKESNRADGVEGDNTPVPTQSPDQRQAKNTPPNATDLSIKKEANKPTIVELQGIDPDPGTELTASIVTPPSSGSLGEIDQTAGTVEYTPKPDFVGEDRFTYVVTDEKGAKSQEARISISVNEAENTEFDDLLSLTDDGTDNHPPEAIANAFETTANTPAEIILGGNDNDPNTELTASIVTPPSSGSLGEIDQTSGTVKYTPSTGFVGEDSFTYIVTDEKGAESQEATISITVNEAESTNVGPLLIQGSTTHDVSIPAGASNPGGGHYVKALLTIHKGDTVTWTNEDSTLHTVTSGISPTSPDVGKEFDSGMMSSGSTFEFKFDKVGTFEYFCSIHSFGTGIINVE